MAIIVCFVFGLAVCFLVDKFAWIKAKALQPLVWRIGTVLLAAIVFFGILLIYDYSLSLLVYGFFVTCLLTSAIIDLKYKLLPNVLNFAGMGFAVAANGITSFVSSDLSLFLTSVLGLVVCGGIIFIIAFISRGGMGMGDVKYAAMIGGFLGLANGLCCLWLAVILGGIIGALLIALKKATRKTAIPFGPFLCAGALIMLFYEAPIKQYFLGMYNAYIN
jgi:leader peptidase (prepilin peptidase)/N-methyltransferase